MEPLGIYLHVPFCTVKCPYCDFYSLGTQAMTDAEEVMDAYVDAMLRELAQWGQRLESRQADTVYFGGGTPLLLGSRRISRLLQGVRAAFALTQQAEITLEANPATALAQEFARLHEAGVNRLSFGLQSSCKEELRLLGRRHTAQQAAQCVLDAQAAGFTNLSLDLMLGLPGQSEQTIADSIAFCSSLNVPHISAYLLKVEPGTPFQQQGIQALCPDEDTQADWYLLAVQSLARHGYRQYEISNFSRSPETQSRHNLKYWRCQEYLGLGPSAHSFLNGSRMYYPRDLDSFLTGAGSPGYFPVPDGEGGGFEEAVLLGLRLNEGISLGELGARFPQADCAQLARRATPLRRAGLLEEGEDRLALTPRGFLLSNSIITKLLYGV